MIDTTPYVHGARIIEMLRMNEDGDDPGLAAHQLAYLLDLPEDLCAAVCHALAEEGWVTNHVTNRARGRGPATRYWRYHGPEEER